LNLMRLLFTLLLMVASSHMVLAQCTPDPLYADSTFGIWPNPSEELPDAMVNHPYSLVLNLKVPLSGGDIDPNFNLVMIESATISSISNVPDGLGYLCDDGTDCDWDGGQQGCVHVSGIPTTAGTYSIDVNLSISPQGSPIAIPYSFTDLQVVVLDDTTDTSVDELSIPVLNLQRVSVSGSTLNVRYQSNKPGIATVRVLDLLGKPVSTTNVSTTNGSNNARVSVAGLPAGIYFVALEQNNQRATRRLLITQR